MRHPNRCFYLIHFAAPPRTVPQRCDELTELAGLNRRHIPRLHCLRRQFQNKIQKLGAIERRARTAKAAGPQITCLTALARDDRRNTLIASAIGRHADAMTKRPPHSREIERLSSVERMGSEKGAASRRSTSATLRKRPDPAILRLARALARQAAREDHEREL